LLLLLQGGSALAQQQGWNDASAPADPLLTLGYDPVAARQEHGAYLGCFNGTRLWEAGVLLDWAQLLGSGGGWGGAGAAANAPTAAQPWPLPSWAASRCPDVCKRAGYPIYAISRGYECACLGQAPAVGAHLSDGACDAAPEAGAVAAAAAAPSSPSSASNATTPVTNPAQQSRETLALFYLHDADAARVALITPDMPGGGADASTGAACRVVSMPLLPPPGSGVAGGGGNNYSSSSTTAAFDVAYNPSNVVWGDERGALEQLAATRMRPASAEGQSTAAALRVGAAGGAVVGGTRLDGAEAVAYGLHSWRAKVSAEPGVVTSWYLRSDKKAADGDVDEVRVYFFLFFLFFSRVFSSADA
jgi:hypothetical protein